MLTRGRCSIKYDVTGGHCIKIYTNKHIMHQIVPTEVDFLKLANMLKANFMHKSSSILC